LQQSLAIREAIGDQAGMGATLNNLSQIYDARGDYETALSYLQQSLAIQEAIGDQAGMGVTLNNLSQIYRARGDYETALSYLQQSLAIQEAIGDVAGLCATLFNMGHIHLQNEAIAEAVSTWVTVYQLAKPRNLAEILNALDNLAGHIGIENGLAGWEELAKHFEAQE
jgi:tetratricopeptide (TPR) repeat protein